MATVSQRFTAVEGPMKKEVINLSAVNSADTVTSNLQRPVFAYFVPTSATVAANDVGTLVEISGRTITLTNAGLVAETGVLVIYGF